MPREDLNQSIPPARVYVLPGRYADQWDNVPQCDADGDNVLDAGCAEHAYPVRTMAIPPPMTARVMSAGATCANELCRLPMAEQDVSSDNAGYGPSRWFWRSEADCTDGGTRACFVDESTGVNCDNTAP